MVTAMLEDMQTLNNAIEKKLLLFLQAIELSGSLEIIGTAFPETEEVFVIRDRSKAVGVEGAYVEVSINEIVNKAVSNDKAEEFVRVINNDRPPIVLNGVTRIVGYYSRTNNWNKSKIGELRDRAKGTYGLTHKNALFHDDRMKTINAL